MCTTTVVTLPRSRIVSATICCNSAAFTAWGRLLIQHRNLRFLFFRQLGPSAFLETLDQILPLFHCGISIGERKGTVPTILFALF